jgi:hypothetical protein
MRSEEREWELILGGVMKREIKMIVGGVERRVSGGNKDIGSQEIEDPLAFMIWVVVGVLLLLGLFPCLGLLPELGG